MTRLLMVLALAVFPAMATAQDASQGAPGAGEATAPPVTQSSVLVLDFERLFGESAFGRRIERDIERAGERIAAENRRIEAELIEEERRLTRERDGMAPEEFRMLAQEFDDKVQRLRDEQDAKARALGARSEEARRAFLEAAQPVLQRLMQAAGAQLVVERRTVFMSADAIDVTDAAIARIDAAIGEGDGLPGVSEDADPGAAADPDLPVVAPPGPVPPGPVPPDHVPRDPAAPGAGVPAPTLPGSGRP